MLLQMSLTHTKLLEEWRERASMGQLDARRVIAEMLTPSGELAIIEHINPSTMLD